jgi:Transcription initiation factor TFIIIB, Brf1 subunit/Transcription initiation factor TFIIB
MRTNEPNDVIEDDPDDYCPECFSDDVIELETGELRCTECGAVTDY